MKNLYTISDLRDKEISEILNFADQLKYEKQNHVAHPLLAGKTLGVMPGTSTSRTRVCLEVGMYDLGGQTVSLTEDIMTESAQKIAAAARVYSRFVDGVAIRTSSQKNLMTFVENSAVPVLSGATSESDPCQALADLMTIRERCGSFAGQKLCYVGAVCGASLSLIAGALTMGMQVSVFFTSEKDCAASIGLIGQEPGQLTEAQSIAEAVADAVVVCTGPDSGVQIDAKLLSLAHSDVLVLHQQPARIGDELSDEVFRDHEEEIFDEAENKLHVIKAALVKLLR